MAETETQAVTKRDSRPLDKAGFAFLPKTWEDLYAYAKEISQTDFVPKTMTGKPGAVLAAWQTGQEVGLPPMAALSSIAIINGRPSIHSDGYWALITSHPLCEWFKETPPDDALKQGFGECTIKRLGNPHPIVRRFSMDEAKTAGLIGKDNWKNYPGDMLQNRARHRAGSDAIPEATQGILPADIARDLEPRDVTPEAEPLKIPQAVDGGEPTSASDSTQVGVGRSEVGKDNAAPAANGDSKGKSSDKKEKALQWVAEAPDAEIMDNSMLNSYLKGLKQDEQLEVCQKYNARRQEIVAELEKSNAANAG